MCAPLAAIPLITMIGAGVSAAAGGVATVAKIQQDNAQAAVATANANSEKLAAAQDQTSMNQAALTRYQQISQTEGNQRAAQAANGVNLNFGNPAESQGDTALLGSMDVNKIYQTGFHAQRGHDVNIANDEASASAAKSNATMSAIGGVLNFGSTVLGGVSQYGKLSGMMGGTYNPPSYSSYGP